MIIRMIVKLSLEDESGDIIKQKEYGRAYLTEIDMEEAAADWWRVTLYNRDRDNHDKKKYPRHCAEVSKIADILTNQLKMTILNKFLCDRKAIEEEYIANKGDV